MITIHHIADCDDFWAEDSEIVDSYLQNIEKYDLLSEAEEQELLTRAIEGDEEAFDKVMCANLRYTVSLANEYQNKGLSQLDLLNTTMQGLVNAIRESTSRPQLTTSDIKFILKWEIRQVCSIQGVFIYHHISRLLTLNYNSHA